MSTVRSLTSLVLGLSMLSGCGGSQGGGSDDSAAEATPPPESAGRSFSVVIDAGKPLPPCDGPAESSLIYVVAESAFKVCQAGTWTAIDIKGAKGDSGAAGKDGAAGTNGTDGKDGTDNHIVASILCTGSLENTALYFSYSAALMASGDVFAEGSIADGNIEISGSKFYSSQQNGALTAAVLFNDDFVAPYNGGYWSIKLDRGTLVTTIVYSDVDAVGGGSVWTMDPTACVANKYD